LPDSGSGKTGPALWGRPPSLASSAAAVAGYVVEFAFGGLGLIPVQADAKIPEEGITWNCTTWLNIAFLPLAASLLVRFLRAGGPPTLRMMGGSPYRAEHEHGGDRMYNGYHH
jgi:hypothetical protein